MKLTIEKIAEIYAHIRVWAEDYEPAVARTAAAAVFQLLAGLGIAVGDLPEQVDAVLAFVAIAATLLAGRSIRKRVTSRATERERDRERRRQQDIADRIRRRR